MLLDSINSIADINQRIAAAVNDGEDCSFELKGTDGRPSPNRDDKKRFAKELCAFANTYGGVLCVHKGADDNLQPFEDAEIGDLTQSLEGWSRDSLEPRCPMRLKVVDNYVLLGINESVTKPHRSAGDKHYYYRHETQSEKMPEIMIASLYRGQAVLQTKSIANLFKMGGNTPQLYVRVGVTNESRVPGTSPRIQLQLFSKYQGLLEYSGQMIASLSDYTSYFKKPFDGANWINWNGVFTTNGEYQRQVLYPADSLTLKAVARINALNPNQELPRYFIIRIDTMFLQSIRHVTYALADIEEQKTLTISTEDECGALVEQFIRLDAQQNGE